MSLDTMHLQTRSQNYDKPVDKKEDQSSLWKFPSTSSLESSSIVPLSIEKPTLDMILHPPKSTLRKDVFNPKMVNFIMWLKISLLHLVRCLP